jgi:hypothetical protein
MKQLITYLLTATLSILYINSTAQTDDIQHYQSPKIIISPNPSPGNYFIIENDSCTYDHFERLLIYNSNGFLIQNKQLQMFKGITKQQVDISGFQPGNYYIRIIDIKNPAYSFATQLVVD